MKRLAHFTLVILAASASAEPPLDHPDPVLRRALFDRLDPDRAERLLAGPTEAQLAEARRAVARLGSDDPAERDAATELLSSLGDAGFRLASAALASPDPEVARRARDVQARLEKALAPEFHFGGLARALACRRLALAGRVAPLERALADPDPRVRLAAVAGLRRLEALPDLSKDPDARVRAAASRPRPSILAARSARVRLVEGGEWSGMLEALSSAGDCVVGGVAFCGEEVLGFAFDRDAVAVGPHRLWLTDGSILSGHFGDLDLSRLSFVASFGRIEIARDRLARITLAPDWPDPPFPTVVEGDECIVFSTDEHLADSTCALKRFEDIESADPWGLNARSGRHPGWRGLRTSVPAAPRGPWRLVLDNGDVLYGDVRSGRFIGSAFAADVLPRARLLARGPAGASFRAVACSVGDRIDLVDDSGALVRSIRDVANPHDVDVLDDGGVLVADRGNGRVAEFGPDGALRWSSDAALDPVAVERLPDGNTLITDLRGRKVVEVLPSGAVVWSLENIAMPIEADRLPDGRTLLCEAETHRVVEIDFDGYIHAEFPGITYPADADRLDDGSTIVADRDLGAVLCFDDRGQVLWRWLDIADPYDVDARDDGRVAVVSRQLGAVLERSRDGRDMKTWSGFIGPLEVE